jgi:pyruvate/2-oxoacid:ferredoxin oxidoreductase beta subunit
MKKWLIGFSVAATLSACVTINIYFPAAAAEKAADKIIEEVWQLKDAETQSKATPKSTPETKPTEASAK